MLLAAGKRPHTARNSSCAATNVWLSPQQGHRVHVTSRCQVLSQKDGCGVRRVPLGAAGPRPQRSHGEQGTHMGTGKVLNVLSASPCWLCPSLCSEGEGKCSQRAKREGQEGETGDGEDGARMAPGRAQQLGCTESRVLGERASPAAGKPQCTTEGWKDTGLLGAMHCLRSAMPFATEQNQL